MNNPSPRVSVCIPAYRAEATIEATIKSVLEQSFSNFELVVIDDCSPDGTRSVIEGFADPRLRYEVNNHNLGPEGNWNRCLQSARGEYIKILPQDDILHPNCLERQISILDADQENQIALVFSARNVITPEERIVTHRGYPDDHEGRIKGQKVMRACVRRGTNLIGEPGGVMFRKSLADKTGAFDATNPYVIDLDYWFRLLRAGDAYYFTDHLASFRVSKQSWSYAIGAAQDRDFTDFASRMSASIHPPLTMFDLLSMRIAVKINKWLRVLFYTIFLR